MAGRGRIPEAFIQELLARTDIVAVVGSRVPLKRSGREFAACCPFHAEKTPSFTVSPQKQFFHCFGCGSHGTAIGFVMQFDGLEFVDAVEELAEQAGLEVPREGGAARPDAPADGEALYAILAEAEAFYRTSLKSDDEAVAYLRGRGLSGDVAARYRLGTAPSAWRALADALGTSAARRDLLARAGLVAARGDGTPYDRFRGRIMFPIHDSRGRPIAFGGRIFGASDGPKYLNSPETELFHKGRELYGLAEARQAAGRPDRLVVVEGYMDVLALVQHGLEATVATLGTAVTADQARLLFRAAPEIVFCFDGDRAGRQAAERALEAVLPELRDGRQARFLFLPEGEDPDSLVRREGADGLQDRLARAIPLSEFFFARFQAAVDMHSLEGRSTLVARCRPWLERMPDGHLRAMMFERLAELARTRAAALPPAGAATAAPGPRPPPPTERMNRVRRAVRALLHAPAAAAEAALPEPVRALARPGIDLLAALHDWCAAHPEATTAQVLTHFAEHPHAPALSRLAAASPFDEEAAYHAEYRDQLALLADEAAADAERQALEAALRRLDRADQGFAGDDRGGAANA